MDKRQSPKPQFTVEKLVALLRGAIKLARASSRLPTVETVRTMSEVELKKNPGMGIALQRDWNVCSTSVNQALQITGL